MMPLWLQVSLVAGLALLAWICGLDTTNAAVEATWLWGAAALAGAPLVYRFLLRAR
jgi:hypothetical protein